MQLIILVLLTVLFYTIYIRSFKRFGQYERAEGPSTHKNKTGTITMGGIIFVIMPLFFLNYTSEVRSIVIVVVSYALLGFLDDILIIIKKNNLGLNSNLKMLLEVAIGGIAYYFLLKNNLNSVIEIGSFKIDLKWGYGLFIMLILVSSTNAFNLTDGIDGLCSGLCLIMSVPFIYLSYTKGKLDIMYMLIAFTLALFVFWCFNLPKAFLFMGDTGSLALGALYSITAIYLDEILAFILLSILFILETLSVIIQVKYYKKTKKRIFKMAPFHHHLEAKGFTEIRIDLLFYLIEIILATLVILC